MKSRLTALAAAVLMSVPFTTQADPAAFVGLAYSFGGNAGLTVKVLSDDEEHKTVGALGVTYYFNTPNSLGLDVSAGRTFSNSAATIGWDFLQQNAQVSGGWADTEDDKKSGVTEIEIPNGGPTS